MAARYGKGTADYINCPLTKEEYDRFIDALISAQSVEGNDWENLNYFEGCLPIEEIARRGRDTLRFGPMKPVGLRRSAHRQMALCGGATAAGEPARRLLQPGRLSESPEVWRPGARAAADPRPGKCEVPALRADPSQYLHQRPDAAHGVAQPQAPSGVFFAGQISGVEGYTESIAMGMLAGIHVARIARDCRRSRRRARRRSARWCTTSATLKAKISSRPTSL